MTPREPDRYEAKAREIVLTAWDYDLGRLVRRVAAALRAAEADALERAARLALNPYGEEVQCYGGDEPFAVGKKIAKAIRALALSSESPPAKERQACDGPGDCYSPEVCAPPEPVALAPSAAEKRIAELEHVLREAREHLLSYWRMVGSRPVDLAARIDAALASPGAAGEETHKP